MALDEAFRRALSPPDTYERDFDAEGIARKDTNNPNRDPEMREGKAVTWSSGLIFYGRISATTAPEDGWYRFATTVSGIEAAAVRWRLVDRSHGAVCFKRAAAGRCDDLRGAARAANDRVHCMAAEGSHA